MSSNYGQLSQREATVKMSGEARTAKLNGDRAKRQFDSRQRMIEIKASSNINIYNSYALSRVSEIASEAKDACDDLYATCQTLVETLDALCRPLLAYSPSGEAIKAVADVIKELNENSDINYNFSATLDGANLGGVGRAKYSPSISNKMIQKFWQQKYAESPYAIEYEKKKRAEAAEALKKREEERKRQAEETAIAKSHKEKIEAECNELAEAFSKNLFDEIPNLVAGVENQLKEQVSLLTTEKKECESTLKSLGVFSFIKKKQLQKQMKLIDNEITRLSDPQLINDEEKKLKAIASQAIEAYKKEIKKYILKRFPNIGEYSETANKYLEAKEFSSTPYPVAPNVKDIFKTNEQS